MMKRVLSLCIALMLTFSLTSALATTQTYKMTENFKSFDVEVAIPEGALYKQNPQDGWLCMELWYDDDTKPLFDLNVSFSEIADSDFLADFSEEGLEHLLEMVNEDYSMPQHEYFDTPSGNKILLTTETDPEAGGYATMITVYKGYFFSLYCWHDDYSALTEADLALMHQLVEGTWITDTEQ